MNANLMRKVAIWAGGLLLAIFFLLAHKFENFSQRDPDRYYHFALSRQMVESGKIFLREVPQVEGLGWNKFFMEKEFLFHQVTALGYRFGGDNGVIAAAWILALSGILIFYIYASLRLGPIPGFLAAGIFFCGPTLIWRLLMVRPHVMAIAFFTAIVASALKKSRWGFFISIFLFTMAYHAFYMPLVVIGASFLAHYLTRSGPAENGEWNLYLFGLAGLVCGIFLNPHFPANIVSGAQIALIPSLMSGKLRGVGFGDELYPLASNAFLTGFSIPLLIFLVAIWCMSRDHRRSGFFGYASVFLIQLMFVYLLITFQSQRGKEYLIPVAAFLAVEIWASFGSSLEKGVRQLALAAAGLVLAWHSWSVVQDIKLQDQTSSAYAKGMLQAAAALPKDEAALVFNCEWDASPYLFYARPKMRFLDIMDPSLLYFANEEAHQAREQLKVSEVADGYGLLKNAFKADYVYCRSEVVVSQMERDPRFRRLFPKNIVQDRASSGGFVYEVRREPLMDYVKGFELGFLPATNENFRRLGPKDSDPTAMKEAQLTYSGFLDLSKELRAQMKAGKEGQALCALVRPKDMRELAGATYLSFGGGRNIRAWRNGLPWFQSEYAYLQAAMHQQIIPLEQPLKVTDQLEFVICSAANTNSWGLSLLGLTEKKFAEICQWKRAYEKKEEAPFDFPYGRRNQTCLGDAASALVPPGLR